MWRFKLKAKWPCLPGCLHVFRPSRFSPVELSIGGIRTVIIDPHNEILPHWFGEFLRQKCRLVVVRIDAHHDMFHCCPALPAREGREKFLPLLPFLP